MSSLKSQARTILARRRTELRDGEEVPPRFAAFCGWLGVALSPAQELCARVLYDGEDIPDTDLGRALFGRTGPVPPDARGVVAAVCGGRGGKSHRLVALRLLHGMLTRDLSSLAAGQRAVALVIAPRDSLRQEVINYVRGACALRPELRRMLRGDPGEVSSTAEIRRPDGRVVVLEGGVATHGGYGGRGRSLTDFAMDEVAFFRDSSYRVNDAEIYKAASPRVLPGGQTILASTPWAQSGLLWDLYSANWGKPTTALAVKATTTQLNPSDWARAIVERERVRDPENARREFDAEFMAGGTTVFFDSALIDGAIDDALNAGRQPEPRDIARAGADFGFRSDSSALAVVHLVGDRLLTAELVERRPEPGKPLVPSETVASFRDRCHAHGVTYVTADGHYREAIVEHLGAIRFTDAPAAPHEAFVRARTLLREGKVRLPRHERLIRQLREVEARPLPGGGMSIHMPRWRTGGHGDLAQAWVLAVASFGGEAWPEPEPQPGTVAWEDREREKRRREYQQRSEQRFSREPWKVNR